MKDEPGRNLGWRPPPTETTEALVDEARRAMPWLMPDPKTFGKMSEEESADFIREQRRLREEERHREEIVKRLPAHEQSAYYAGIAQLYKEDQIRRDSEPASVGSRLLALFGGTLMILFAVIQLPVELQAMRDPTQDSLLSGLSFLFVLAVGVVGAGLVLGAFVGPWRRKSP